MSNIGGLFGAAEGGGVNAESFLLWGVAYGAAQALLNPVYTALGQAIWGRAVPAGLNQVLSPPDLADMVVKNLISQANGEATAASSGIAPSDFDLLVLNTGEPPGLETVMEMARRNIIAWTDQGPEVPSVERAVLTSHIYDYWFSALQQMGDVTQPNGGVPISPADAVAAALRGQRPLADMATEAGLSAVNPARFQILLDTAGRPPSPGELVEFLRRKLIPLEGTGPDALTFQQGIYEGDTKDKWWELYSELALYIVPPRSIATLQSHGVVTPDQAATLYQFNGLDPATAAAYAQSAVATRVAAHTQLTEANILKLYTDRLATADQAVTMLENIGTPAPIAAYLLELQDFNVAAKAYTSAVSRVESLYVGHKITPQSAVNALDALDVPAAARDALIQDWNQALAVNVKVLTAAEIADAMEYGIMGQDEAQGELEALGYSPFDAWVVLSVKAKGPLPNPPGPGPGPGMATPTT